MTKHKLISLILCIMVVGSCVFISTAKVTASADDDSGDLLIGTDMQEYMIPIVQEYDEADITAYGDKEDLNDEDKEATFDESHDNLMIDLPEEMDVRYYFWGESPKVPYDLIILTDDLYGVSGGEYLVRLYVNNKWEILKAKDNGNGTATVSVTEVGPIAIYVPITTSESVSNGEVLEEGDDDENVPSVQAGLTSRKGSKTKALPTEVKSETTHSETLETMMVPYGAYEDLTGEEWKTFKAGYDTLKTAIPDGMLARFFFWCSANESPYPMSFTMEDVTIADDCQIKMYVGGQWIDVECKNNGGGSISATFTGNGPTAIFTEKR